MKYLGSILAAMMIQGASAEACTIGEVPLKYQVMCSDEIFFGKVSSIEKSKKHLPYVDHVMKVKVEQSLKGSLSGDVEIYFKKVGDKATGIGPCLPGQGRFTFKDDPDTEWVFMVRKKGGYLFTESISLSTTRSFGLKSIKDNYSKAVKDSPGSCAEIDPKWKYRYEYEHEL